MNKKRAGKAIDFKSSLMRIRFEDLVLFESVARLGSLAAAAREQGRQAPYVTKAMQRIEDQFGRSFFRRSAQGVSLTPDGGEFLGFCRDLLGGIEGGKWFSGQTGRVELHPLTLVGPPFLLTHLAAPSLPKLMVLEKVALTMLDLTTSRMADLSAKDAFEAALHCDPVHWSRLWKSYPVGTIEWILVGRAGHPLGARAGEREVLKYPFVLPGAMDSQGPRAEGDACPLPMKSRFSFIRSSSGEMALRAAEKSDHLVFLPEIQASEMIQQRKMMQITVPDWAPIRKTVSLTVHQDKVTQKRVQSLIHALRATNAGARSN